MGSRNDSSTLINDRATDASGLTLPPTIFQTMFRSWNRILRIGKAVGEAAAGSADLHPALATGDGNTAATGVTGQWSFNL